MAGIILTQLYGFYIKASVHARGPAPIALGTAANYAILAKSGVSTVPASSISTFTLLVMGAQLTSCLSLVTL